MVTSLVAFDAQYSGTLCGIDEAGRGPWAGPVIAAAAIWKETTHVPTKLTDSKKLSAKQRETLFPILIEHCEYGIGIASVEEIDQLNILQATFLAMQRAFAALSSAVDVALIDGNHIPQLPCQAVPVIKGDSQSASISAASIIAKVTRDRMMQEIAAAYPGYGFEKHVGYGTAQHQAALASLGVTPHHRQSFAPIRKLIEKHAA